MSFNHYARKPRRRDKNGTAEPAGLKEPHPSRVRCNVGALRYARCQNDAAYDTTWRVLSMFDRLLDLASHGLLDTGPGAMLLYLFMTTQLTILTLSLYLHRSQTHRAVDFHPVLAHAFRFWSWLTTAMVTRGWVAVHRKHHAHVDTEQDPHSPYIVGIGQLLWKGTELYTTVSPLAIWVGSEELHNNHHAFPSSVKFSVRRFEVDLGWLVIQALIALGLARVRCVAVVEQSHMAARRARPVTLAPRVRVMTAFFRKVTVPAVHEEIRRPRGQAFIAIDASASWTGGWWALAFGGRTRAPQCMDQRTPLPAGHLPAESPTSGIDGYAKCRSRDGNTFAMDMRRAGQWHRRTPTLRPCHDRRHDRVSPPLSTLKPMNIRTWRRKADFSPDPCPIETTRCLRARHV
jgi:fatty-acid desaturase